MIEMTADAHSARGGVLEAAGLVEIKFRADRQRATMLRLDPTYAQLARDASEASGPAQAEARQRLEEREKHMAPFFHAMAVEYADAHDRAGRMLATGALRHAMPWAETRRYFYWRGRRRMMEVRYLHAFLAAQPTLPPPEAAARVCRAASYVPHDDDAHAVAQLEAHTADLDAAVERARADAIVATLAQLSPETRDYVAAQL